MSDPELAAKLPGLGGQSIGDDRPVHIVSYSELTTARQCPLKHQLSYKERWRKDVGGARYTGVRWHEVMAAHYLTLGNIQTRQFENGTHDHGLWKYSMQEKAEVAEAVGRVMAAQPNDQTALVIAWMYQNHLTVRGFQSRYRVVDVEAGPVVPLPDAPGAKMRFELKTRIDLIVFDEITNTIWVIDHKSGAAQGKPSNKLSQLDEQFGLYAWALRQTGVKVFGSRYQWTSTYQHTSGRHLPTEYIEDCALDRTDSELNRIAEDATRTALLVYEWDHETRGAAPSSPDPELCKRRCDFANAHIAARRGTIDLREYLANTGFEIDKTRH